MKEKFQSVTLIGCGNITKTRHIPAINSLNTDSLSVNGLIGLDYTNVEICQKLTKSNQYYVGKITIDEHPEWLKESDLVIIGTPPQTHVELLSTVLQVNHRAIVIVEKPVCLSDEINSLKDLIMKYPGRIFVMHNFQFSEGFQKIVYWLNNNKLGKIKSIVGFQNSTKDRRLPVWHEDLPYGLFWDEAVHFFYLIESLCGALEVKSGTVFIKPTFNTPALLNLDMISKTNVPISITMNFEGALSEWGLVISGTEGTAIYDFFRDIPIYLSHDRNHLAWNILRTSYDFIRQHIFGFIRNGLKFKLGNLHYGIDEVIRKCINKDFMSENMVSADDGIRIIGYMEEAIGHFDKNQITLERN